MRKPTGYWLTLAIVVVSLVPATASAVLSPQIRLTAIEDRFSGAACRLTLDPGGKTLVGGMDYYNEHGAWHLGLNGRDHRLSEVPGSNVTLLSGDRKISVRIRKLQRVWKSRDESYPAEKHKVSVSVTMNGSTATFAAYELCGDG